MVYSAELLVVVTDRFKIVTICDRYVSRVHSTQTQALRRRHWSIISIND